MQVLLQRESSGLGFAENGSRRVGTALSKRDKLTRSGQRVDRECEMPANSRLLSQSFRSDLVDRLVERVHGQGSPAIRTHAIEIRFCFQPACIFEQPFSDLVIGHNIMIHQYTNAIKAARS